MELYKYSNHRNSKYLKWLRTQKCIVSGMPADCAHHIRLGTNGGQGIKPSDYFCIPLTDEFHTVGSNSVHRIGEETFLMINDIEKVEFFIFYLNAFLKDIYTLKIDNKFKDKFDYLFELIEACERDNIKQAKTTSPAKLKAKSEKAKVSLLENEFYQNAKTLRKENDKELRKKLKASTPKTKTKIKISDSEYYQEAKELNRKYAKEMRDKNKESNSEYRKAQYQKLKALQKSYNKPSK